MSVYNSESEHDDSMVILRRLSELIGMRQLEDFYVALVNTMVEFSNAESGELSLVEVRTDKLNINLLAYRRKDEQCFCVANNAEKSDHDDSDLPERFNMYLIAGNELGPLRNGADKVVGLIIDEKPDNYWFVELRNPGALTQSKWELMGEFGRAFAIQVDNWEYANLDSLTGLRNRKTFDEQFEQFLYDGNSSTSATAERRLLSDDEPDWLAVFDIDHFKRVNDNFGHLFGDEVLLRFANLMKKYFRANDKLFRFGGEEFVVMLKNISAGDIKSVLERFRTSIEEYTFPQVGTVTVSIGYIKVNLSYAPAEMIGHADEALYYSKQHGRNQSNNYDQLIADGKLVVSSRPDQSQIESTIDELFS